MLEQQLQLELNMINRGIERYRKSQSNAVEQGRGDETSYSQRLLPDLVTNMAQGLADKLSIKGRGPVPVGKRLLMGIDPAIASLIAMKCILQDITTPAPIQTVALRIGSRVEDDLKFTKFELEAGNYYKELIKDFKRKGSRDYRYKHRVLTKTMNDREISWNSWSKAEKLQVGIYLVEICITHTEIVRSVLERTGRKTERFLQPTPAVVEWIRDHMDEMEMLAPDLGPCIIKPRDWAAIDDGGYHTLEVSQRVPFVKLRGSAARRAISGADLSTHMRGVNAMQSTAWAINRPVLAAMQAVYAVGDHAALPRKEPYEIPESPVKDTKKADFTEEQTLIHTRWRREAAQLYTLEKERVGKNIQFMRVMRQAREYAQYDDLYFVYQCDFRGRVYATSTGISPQGADFNKALIRFSHAKVLGTDGWFWLRVHGANLLGADKQDYPDRVRYIEEHHAEILAAADDPLSSRFWIGADKPWQFLAFAYEYAAAVRSGEPTTYASSLPVGLDGSCNGLQNFSAMLRDAVGGSATNLIGHDTPADIYQEVADLVVRKLDSDDNEFASQWRAFGITRKCTKTPVMTLPYGSTKITCRDAVEDYIHDNRANNVHWDTQGKIIRAALYLSDLIWAAIGEVVIAARAAMKWIQDSSRILTKAGKPLLWPTPTGFVVYQANRKHTLQKVECRLLGRVDLRIRNELPGLCSRKQSNGSAPNFVHSMDSSHMIFTIIDSLAAGITHFAMIHDDFGTHACNIPKLHTCIRTAFVGMYTKHDVLQEFKDVHEVDGIQLPDLPEKGTLDINEVLDAPHFFG